LTDVGVASNTLIRAATYHGSVLVTQNLRKGSEDRVDFDQLVAVVMSRGFSCCMTKVAGFGVLFLDAINKLPDYGFSWKASSLPEDSLRTVCLDDSEIADYGGLKSLVNILSGRIVPKGSLRLLGEDHHYFVLQCLLLGQSVYRVYMGNVAQAFLSDVKVPSVDRVSALTVADFIPFELYERLKKCPNYAVRHTFSPSFYFPKKVSRSYYKLMEINDRRKLIWDSSVVLDMGAPPGGFVQYCEEVGATVYYAVYEGGDCAMKNTDSRATLLDSDGDVTLFDDLLSMGKHDGERLRFGVILSDACRHYGDGVYDKVTEHVPFISGALASAMMHLVEGGALFFKFFLSAYDPVTVGLLTFASSLFHDFDFVKLKSSYSTSTEMYFVGIGFLRSEKNFVSCLKAFKVCDYSFGLEFSKVDNSKVLDMLRNGAASIIGAMEFVVDHEPGYTGFSPSDIDNIKENYKRFMN